LHYNDLNKDLYYGLIIVLFILERQPATNIQKDINNYEDYTC
jgi:hypothetical protein